MIERFIFTQHEIVKIHHLSPGCNSELVEVEPVEALPDFTWQT